MDNEIFKALDEAQGQEISSLAAEFMAQMVEKVKKYKELCERAEHFQAEAKRAAELAVRYKDEVLCADMVNFGIDSFELEGKKVSLRSKFYCNPNKNEADKELIAEWLTSKGGASLLKERAVVSGAQEISRLKESGVGYERDVDINSNSLKAYIKDLLGLGPKGGVAQIQLSDIPACIHFFEMKEVVIE